MNRPQRLQRLRRWHGPTRRETPRIEGFTFMELIIVIAMVGIFFAFAIPNFDGLTPKYRLRTGVRTLGAKVEMHRVLAITRGVRLGVRYVMDEERSYFELIRPPPPEYPSQPLSERKSYAKEYLPTGVFIEGIEVRGAERQTDGRVIVAFSPTGNTGSHIVTLSNERGMTWSMILNSITGTVDYASSEEVAFDDFEG